MATCFKGSQNKWRVHQALPNIYQYWKFGEVWSSRFWECEARSWTTKQNLFAPYICKQSRRHYVDQAMSFFLISIVAFWQTTLIKYNNLKRLFCDKYPIKYLTEGPGVSIPNFAESTCTTKPYLFSSYGQQKYTSSTE